MKVAVNVTTRNMPSSCRTHHRGGRNHVGLCSGHSSRGNCCSSSVRQGTPTNGKLGSCCSVFHRMKVHRSLRLGRFFLIGLVARPPHDQLSGSWTCRSDVCLRWPRTSSMRVDLRLDADVPIGFDVFDAHKRQEGKETTRFGLFRHPKHPRETQDASADERPKQWKEGEW